MIIGSIVGYVFAKMQWVNNSHSIYYDRNGGVIGLMLSRIGYKTEKQRTLGRNDNAPDYWVRSILLIKKARCWHPEHSNYYNRKTDNLHSNIYRCIQGINMI